MKLSFDYFHNLEGVEFYLCNPDGKELFPLVGFDRKLTLRFNDLSELTFVCNSTVTLSDGSNVHVEAYDYVETRRLIFVTDIGWFVIDDVQETDNGIAQSKSVTCHSLQATLRDIGISCEERVYYFYNPADPFDDEYDPENEVCIPSVMGQLFKQLGIQQSLQQGRTDPAEPYDEWTITYVTPGLIGKARSFQDSTEYGYDWIAKTVANAFEVIILFDFYYKTIQVLYPNEMTQLANVVYSFNNFMKEIEVNENADNIITVMNCIGNNCDISDVNPTGTKYICDFSYYMDDDNRWMSSALKAKLNAWKAAVESAKPDYEEFIMRLRSAYEDLASMKASLTEVSEVYSDLSVAVAKKAASAASSSVSSGIVWCETVNIGSKSLDEDSFAHNTPLSVDDVITAYKNRPDWDEVTQRWVVSGDSYTNTLQNCLSYLDGTYKYFIDHAGTTSKTYCIIQGGSVVDKETFEVQYVCKGLKRYTDLSFANVWTGTYDSVKSELQTEIDNKEDEIETLKSHLKQISDATNIISFFSNTPSLLRELRRYWIEGDYTSDYITVYEKTSPEDVIDIENELLEAGKIELAKVCQPKLQFSLQAVNCMNQYEFKQQMEELELGKVIAVERKEGVWYYPALLEMSFDLDGKDTFDLKFANALRLDDWGYTYGDLITKASSTSRQVTANWQNITEYSKDKDQIDSLLKDPLSVALRASFANTTNQEFTVNESGILGKKFTDEALRDSFDPEQIRIQNNTIIFTDDNWETARAAFGKITYSDGQGGAVTAYGLIADAIIGTLLMGEKLNIRNEDSSIILDANGITIKNGSQDVFKADTNGNLEIRGTIHALGGDIGGWNITTVGNEIYCGNAGMTANDSFKKASLVTSGATSPVRFYCGHPNRVSGKFVVLDDGSLYAAAAQITGRITAESGYIGGSNGWVIGSKRIYGTYPDSHSGTIYTGLQTGNDGSVKAFYAGAVSNDGQGAPFYVQQDGTMRASNAMITGGSLLIQSVDENSKTKISDGRILVESINAWGEFGYAALVVYPSYQNNVWYHTSSWGSHYYDRHMSSIRLGVNVNCYTKEPLYGGGYLYQTSVEQGLIFSPDPDDQVVHSFTVGAIPEGAMEKYNGILQGDLPYVYGDDFVRIIFYANRRAQFNSSALSDAELIGNWYGSLSTRSDRNSKNHIELLSELYSNFFDLLEPVRFKLNDGVSGRYHTGFVAQDVESAIVNAGLSTQDAALFVRRNIVGKDGEPLTMCSLRYHEFIALNTSEIQKLKRRVAELENIVASLQNE